MDRLGRLALTPQLVATCLGTRSGLSLRLRGGTQRLRTPGGRAASLFDRTEREPGLHLGGSCPAGGLSQRVPFGRVRLGELSFGGREVEPGRHLLQRGVVAGP